MCVGGVIVGGCGLENILCGVGSRIWVRLITLALSFLYGEKREVLNHYTYIYKKEGGGKNRRESKKEGDLSS